MVGRQASDLHGTGLQWPNLVAPDHRGLDDLAFAEIDQTGTGFSYTCNLLCGSSVTPVLVALTKVDMTDWPAGYVVLAINQAELRAAQLALLDRTAELQSMVARLIDLKGARRPLRRLTGNAGRPTHSPAGVVEGDVPSTLGNDRGHSVVATNGIHDPGNVRHGENNTPVTKTRLETVAQVDFGDIDGLSVRELQVLRLSAIGHSNKAIASGLHIGLKTVDTYKARAMSKLGFQSRVEAVRFAVKMGWVEG